MKSAVQQLPISNVTMVGGTHGNELTGIHLIHEWQKNKFAENYPSLEINYLLANPAARKANKRYLMHDLNRCFKKVDLDNPELQSLEQQRAKEINELLGPKGNPKTDFIMDLHTSTANMQTNIVLTRIDTFHLQLAAYLKEQLEDVVITSEKELMSDHHFLESIANRGIVIEVGAIPQGSLQYDCYQKTENAVKTTLEFIQLYNSQQLPKSSINNIELMSYHSKIYFPTDKQDEISACVHPNLIAQAYPKVAAGDPIFKCFDGKDVAYQGEPTHLAFINEAAYYDQKIAMCCCRPMTLSLEDCRPVSESSTNE
jgi:aspartoacylase